MTDIEARCAACGQPFKHGERVTPVQQVISTRDDLYRAEETEQGYGWDKPRRAHQTCPRSSDG